MNTPETREAVILAAGCGKRLSPATNGRPKCLVHVGGQTLIERHLRVLDDLGIRRVCVILGCGTEEVLASINSCGDSCDFIVNTYYAQTDSLHSLWMARDWVTGPFLLMNTDVLADPDVYRRVLAAEGSALAYDSSSGDEEEHMKVSLRGDLVQSVGKTLSREETTGESVGILKFDGRTADSLFAETNELILAGEGNNWAPVAVNRVAKRLPIRAVNVADLPWIEIDFPEDLERAERVIVPSISAGRQAVPVGTRMRPRTADEVALVGSPRAREGLGR